MLAPSLFVITVIPFCCLPRLQSTSPLHHFNNFSSSKFSFHFILGLLKICGLVIVSNGVHTTIKNLCVA